MEKAWAIANAEINEMGGLKDKGNMILKFNELVTQNIWSYDQGKTLASGLNLARKAGAFGDEYKFGFDDHDKEKITYATIGQTVNEINTTANRDVTNLETTTKDEGSKLDVAYKHVNYKQAIDQINENGGVLNTLWKGVVDGVEGVARAMSMGMGAMVPNPVAPELQDKVSELELTQGGRVDEEALKLLKKNGYESQAGYKYLDLVMVKVMKGMIEQGVDVKFAAKLSLEVLNHMLNKYGIEKFPIIEDIKGDLWNISTGCAYSSECSKFLTTFVPESVEYGSYLSELATGKKIKKELTQPKTSSESDPFIIELEEGYKHKPKAKNVEVYDDEDELEDAAEIEELEALREIIAEWDYEDSVKAAKARIERGGTTERNLISALLVPDAEASDGREKERNSLKETIKEIAGELAEETGKFIVDNVLKMVKENPQSAESLMVFAENSGFYVEKLFDTQGAVIKGWMRIGLGNELADQVSEKVSESMDELFNYALSKLDGMTDNQKVGVASGILVAAAVFKSKQVANKAYDKYLSKYFEPSDAFKITETHVFKNKNELKNFMSNHEVENAVNKFMRGATSKCTNYKIDMKENGNRILSFFAPARNEGYGKIYIQEIDKKGNIVKEFKDTIGPNGKVIQRKWIFGEDK